MKSVLKMMPLWITMAILFIACQHDSLVPEPVPVKNPTDTTGNGTNNDKPCDPDTVYFTKDIFPILKSNCAYSGCHGDGSAQDGVSLVSHQSIIQTARVTPFSPNNSELYEVITETDPDKVMPPPPANKLTNDQIALIAKWINQGALNNYCSECDTTAVTFSQNISPIIQNNCQGCHSGSNPQGGLSLTNYQQIQSEAMNGSLFGVVNHSSGFVPMPYKQNKLSQCQIDQIRIWVDKGALND